MAKIKKLPASLTKTMFMDLKLSDPEYKKTFFNVLNYCHYDVSLKDLVKATQVWVKKNMPDVNQKDLFSLPDSYFESAGKFCYISNSGGELSAEAISKLRDRIGLLANIALDRKNKPSLLDDTEVAPQNEEKKKPGIQEHMFEKACEVCGEIEGWIDDFVRDPKQHDIRDKDVKKHFASAGLKAGHLRYVKQFYEPAVREFKELLDGEDSDLKEAYSHLSKVQIRWLHAFYESILQSVDQIKVMTTTKRVSKTKKSVDINKMVAKLKYLSEDAELGIKSIHPMHVVGAKEIWVYNVRTRKIGHYIALDSAGIAVKGNALKNFAVASSEKMIRKGTKIDIAKFAKSSKTAKHKEFSEIKSIDVRLKGKMNEHTVILAVEK